MNNEEYYPFLVNQVLSYIESIKKDDKETSLLDIIMDFAIKNGIDPQIVGDAIHNDVYLKSFIEKDCELHGIIKSNMDQIEQW